MAIIIIWYVKAGIPLPFWFRQVNSIVSDGTRLVVKFGEQGATSVFQMARVRGLERIDYRGFLA